MSSSDSERTPGSLTVAVTGATGFVGRHLVRELLDGGHDVRALIRDRAKAADTLPADRIAMVEGDIFGRDAMDLLTRGADALIHLIGIRRELPGGIRFTKMHVDATRSAVDAANRNAVPRYVHMSALGARPDAATKYHRTKWDAEEVVRASSLNWTILRPSLILGPDGEFMEMARGWVRGVEPPKRFLPYFKRPAPPVGHPVPESTDGSASIQPVSVRDVARAFRAAMERPDAIGEIYPIVGPDVTTWPQLLIAIRDATPGAKAKIKPLGVPVDIAVGIATVANLVGLGALLPFGPSEPVMATEDNIGTPAKAHDHLEVAPERLDNVIRWSAAA